MTYTTEIESLRIAIAEECGWKVENYGPKGCETLYWRLRKPGEDWSRAIFGHIVPPYTTSIDAIRAAAMERFDSLELAYLFEGELLVRKAETKTPFQHQLTPLDWCIAFARTAKIWRYKV